MKDKMKKKENKLLWRVQKTENFSKTEQKYEK